MTKTEKKNLFVLNIFLYEDPKKIKKKKYDF